MGHPLYFVRSRHARPVLISHRYAVISKKTRETIDPRIFQRLFQYSLAERTFVTNVHVHSKTRFERGYVLESFAARRTLNARKYKYGTDFWNFCWYFSKNKSRSEYKHNVERESFDAFMHGMGKLRSTIVLFYVRDNDDSSASQTRRCRFPEHAETVKFNDQQWSGEILAETSPTSSATFPK